MTFHGKRSCKVLKSKRASWDFGLELNGHLGAWEGKTNNKTAIVIPHVASVTYLYGSREDHPGNIFGSLFNHNRTSREKTKRIAHSANLLKEKGKMDNITTFDTHAIGPRELYSLCMTIRILSDVSDEILLAFVKMFLYLILIKFNHFHRQVLIQYLLWTNKQD